MAYSKEYLNHADLYDFTVINEEGKLDEAIQNVFHILERATK